MKNNLTLKTFIVLSFLFVYSFANAQKDKPQQGFAELAPLTEYDSIMLINLPKLSLPESYKGPNKPSLPLMVDNSTHIYWRPVFSQVALECGQASGIGLGFTYAINRERNVSGSVDENQYATHFTWNFTNGGNGWYGVSYFHSFEIVKTLGNPSVITYGGTSSPSPYNHWMSGYDKYYESMKNRISEVYQIDVSTAEGVETAKHWLFDHLENSAVGGVANFYAQSQSASITLPSGTPEAGKYVQTSWGSANHAMCISGYHDSIRWDYNNDGQYTNDIDLNGDGIITPRDWEIGGFRFANTYAGGPNYGNNGFCYMTYKSAADEYGNGGIWNSSIHVLQVKENTDPLLTAKIQLKHTSREKIRVRMGVSTDIASTSPDYIIGFPIIDFQGNDQYMQGGTTVEANKTIEFGLDLTPLINMIGPGTPARYFLLVDEDDPSSDDDGEVIYFSIIDYTSGVNEILCSQSNVSLINDATTKLWVNHTVNFTDVEITSDLLPAGTVYEPYSTTLEAQNGTTPYFWDFDKNYTESNYTSTYPMVTAEQLNPGSNYATKQLDFSFPFYGEGFDEVRVYTDGYLQFGSDFSWPYTVYDFFEFTKNKRICPFWADLELSTGDGVWYEGNTSSATFRWKASIAGYAGSSELNFAVKILSSGDIKFYYGSINDFPEMEWVSGVSSGDNIYYQFTDVNNHQTIPQGYICDLETTPIPDGFTLNRFGELTGQPEDVYENFPLKVRVRDENNLTDSKVVYFSTDGANYLVIDDYSVISGGDDIIEYGETAYVTISIKSLGDQEIQNANMGISVANEYFSLIDSTQEMGTFQPGEIKTFADAFSFEVSNFVPDGHEAIFDTEITDFLGEVWNSHFSLTAYAPVFDVGNASVSDGGNGVLDPGETADLVVYLLNHGGARANNILTILSTIDPYITINDNSASLNYINANNEGSVLFNITAAENTPIGHIAEFSVSMTDDLSVSGSGNTSIIVGHAPILILDLDDNNSSAPHIEDALNDLGIVYALELSFPTEINMYSAVFVCLGIYSNNYVLSSSEGQFLADYLNQGGRLYMEGGDTWAYDSQTAVHSMFYINGADDGTSDMSIVEGMSGTFTQGMSFEYNSENSWMDHLEPLGSAFLILQNQSPVYGTGIAYDDGSYKTIGTAHEFGGLVDGNSPSTKTELIELYLDFFGVLPPPVLTVDLKLFIEGAYIGGVMQTQLNDDDLIPINHPYGIMPWNYYGIESVVAIPNNLVVDWLLLDFRDALNATFATPSTTFNRQAAFLLSDGSVVGMDGSSAIEIAHHLENNLFVKVWHHNHIGILSANPLPGFNDIFSYDFSVSSTQVHGSSNACKELDLNVWGMIGGDGNNDGIIDFADMVDIWKAAAGEKSYHFGDYNLDGCIDNKDKNDVLMPNYLNY